MKKVIALCVLLLSIILVAGCQKNPEVLTVMVPFGSPALSSLLVQDDEAKYVVDVVNGADPLVAAFGSMSHDFIFAPTNLGAKLYTSSQDYVFLAAVTFGNYYLVTKTEELFNMNYLTGKEIIVFGKNQTSDVIISYIIDALSIDCTVTYVDSVATATALFIADDSKIIMTAEPSLSALLARTENVDVIDLQRTYENITGLDSYPQAGVFGKSTLTKAQINGFLNDLQTSIDLLDEDIEEAISLAIKFDFGFTHDVLITAIPNSHIGFVSAQDCKDDLETYFGLILALNPALIGQTLPVESFYYLP